MKKRIIILLLIFFVTFSYLFSGPPDSKGPNSYCPHQYVRLNGLMGIPVNCDEFSFIGGAAHPGLLITQGFQRQNRPLYIVFGTITGYAIYYLTSPLHKQIQFLLEQKLTGQFSRQEIQKAILYGSIYIAFIILNIIILFFSVLLFEKSIYIISGKWENTHWLLYGFMIMLISNQVTKNFFWTAHQQMFTIFTPIACLYTGLFIWKKTPCIKRLIFFSFIPGTLLLMYGNFLLLLPILLFSYFLILKKEKHFPTTLFIANAALITSAFALPTLLWIIFLKMDGVSYYNHEVADFRHFVWMTDSLKISMSYFFETFYERTIEFLKTSGSLLFNIFLLVTATVIRMVSNPKTKNERNNLFLPKGMWIIVISSFMFFAVFLWLIGSYADRLTFSLAPIILFSAARLINEKKINPKIQWALFIFIFLMHLYTVFFNAPHFSEKLFFE